MRQSMEWQQNCKHQPLCTGTKSQILLIKQFSFFAGYAIIYVQITQFNSLLTNFQKYNKFEIPGSCLKTQHASLSQ